MLSPTSPVSDLTRVGATVASRLARLGIHTVADLLYHLPTTYQDFSRLTPIAQLPYDTPVTIRAKVDVIGTKRSPRKHLLITEALVSDGTASCRITWFSQPYLSKTLHPGQVYFFSGKFTQDNYGSHFLSPEFELAPTSLAQLGGPENILKEAHILPIYPLTANVTQKQMRFLTRQACGAATLITDYLPSHIRQKENLPTLDWSLQHLHFPQTQAESMRARTRLAFDELFLLQLILQRAKAERQSAAAPAIPFAEDATKEFVSRLPFQLTDSQRKAAWTILQDVARDIPMTRLLEGDVGSGKTIVGAIVMLNAALSGFQSALLCPTEILAEQHAASVAKLLEHTDIAVGLLTSAQAVLWQKGKSGAVTKKQFAKQLADGSVRIAIGTHALLQPKVAFANLGLALVDEQHRFGVEQRKALTDKGRGLRPHLLSLSATPIPRSLQLTLFGDLAISQLTDMPTGRKPIITKLVAPKQRDETYAFVRKEVAAGHQVFVICPIIDESDTLGVKAATAEAARLQREVFPDIAVGLLHGKMKAAEKTQILDKFRTHQTPILVATSVVEVGVDIPGATVMIIEGAERFGLAQLHQFRGRIGRRESQAHCFLFSDGWAPETRARLHALVDLHDGFALAEKDLELRGPGDIAGGRQSGIPFLQIASIADRGLAEKARGYAQAIIADDPTLGKSPTLAEKIKKLEERVHWE